MQVVDINPETTFLDFLGHLFLLKTYLKTNMYDFYITVYEFF